LEKTMLLLDTQERKYGIFLASFIAIIVSELGDKV
jgi:putative Ca2+/H+ antiporter (TMEM165/GDT1 family)